MSLRRDTRSRASALPHAEESPAKRRARKPRKVSWGSPSAPAPKPPSPDGGGLHVGIVSEDLLASCPQGEGQDLDRPRDRC